MQFQKSAEKVDEKKILEMLNIEIALDSIILHFHFFYFFYLLDILTIYLKCKLCDINQEIIYCDVMLIVQ